MRRLTTSFLLLLLAFRSFAQQLPEDPEPARGTRQWYLERSKSQKTFGWILVGGGLVLTAVSLGTAASNIDVTPSSNTKNKSAAGVLFAAGVGATLSSIPLFLAAGRNKRKALSMTVKSEQRFLPDPAQRGAFAAVGFRWSF